MSKKRLEIYLERFGDGIHGTPKYDDKGEFYFINGNNLKDGNIISLQETMRISGEEYEKIKRPLNDHTILLSINGTLGRVAIYRGEKIALGKSVCYLNVKNGINKYFIKYVLSTKEFQKYILQVAHGSTIKNLAPCQVAEYEFNVPENLDIDKMVCLLKAIEDKIENNNKINSELGKMAKTIYDYWFLQFKFPNEEGKPYKSSGGKMVWNEELKREIPEEWKSGYLEEMIEICNGKDHQNLEVGGIPVYGSGGILRYVNKNLYHGESVLIPRKGTLNNVIYVDEPFWTVDTMFYTKMKKKDSALFVYYTVKLFDFEKLNTGTGVPSMTSSIIYSLKTIIPDENILEAFNSKVCPLYKEIQHNKKENQELTSLRDFLLPLLMNGQVSFKE